MKAGEFLKSSVYSFIIDKTATHTFINESIEQSYAAWSVKSVPAYHDQVITN